MMKTIVGIEEAAGVNILFAPGEIGAIAYSAFSMSLDYRVVVSEIDGKDCGDLTIRKSDIKTPTTGPLWKVSMTVPVVYDIHFAKMMEMATKGGPYIMNLPVGVLTLYITNATFSQDKGFPEPGDGSPTNRFVGTWQFTFIEKRDVA